MGHTEIAACVNDKDGVKLTDFRQLYCGVPCERCEFQHACPPAGTNQFYEIALMCKELTYR